MDETKLIELINSLGEALRTLVADGMQKIGERCDAIEAKIAKKDAAGSRENQNGDDLAEPVAADAASRADMAYVKAALRDLQIRQPTRAPADRDAMAEIQARADTAFRTHGTQADPPMSGETAQAYSLRMHRAIQRMAPSSKWAKANLETLIRDPETYDRACNEIRADAVAESYLPTGMKEGQPHRPVFSTSTGGHKITTWVGNGTIFKAMSRPVRHVVGIGYRPGMPRINGGSASYDAA